MARSTPRPGLPVTLRSGESVACKVTQGPGWNRCGSNRSNSNVTLAWRRSHALSETIILEDQTDFWPSTRIYLRHAPLSQIETTGGFDSYTSCRAGTKFQVSREFQGARRLVDPQYSIHCLPIQQYSRSVQRWCCGSGKRHGLADSILCCQDGCGCRQGVLRYVPPTKGGRRSHVRSDEEL